MAGAEASGTHNEGFWAAVRESIHGSQRDFTEGSITRAIGVLAVPMVLEMVMESAFAIVNVFWVSRLGAEAVTAVGLTEAMMTIVFTVALGLSMAATAVVARRTGEKNHEAARVAAGQTLLLGAMMSGAISLIGVLFGRQLLDMMASSPVIERVGGGFTTILLGANFSVFFIFVINAVFRGVGDAAVAMRVLWLANAINLVLDPCLIFGLGPFPELGVTGSAISTSVGRGIGVAYQLWLLFRGDGRIRLNLSHLRPRREVLAELWAVALPGMFQYLVATASWVGLVKLVATFGAQVMAGYTVAIRIIMMFLLPSWGLSNAAATLVGQNLGAAKPERAERSVYLAALYNVLFMGVVTAVCVAAAEPILRFFATDASAAGGLMVEWGVRSLRMLSYGNVFYALSMVMVQSFNGAGDTWTPTRINILCHWIIQLPVAWALAHTLGLGATGILYAVVGAESLLAVIATVMFRQGKWKEVKV
ncbi:MAG: MATE family efflux transporter [Acidobacteria bacterium]|nr:MATE family efflux transporter [Acidobacteriota bacterium]